MFNFGDTSSLKKALHERNDKSFQDGKVHQSILEIGYDWWKDQSDTSDYQDMIEWVQTTYGDLAAFAVLVGKYNYQVCNGGHMQYYDNGYANGVCGFLDPNQDESFPTHTKMKKLFESLGLSDGELGSVVYQIVSEFSITSTYCNDLPLDLDDEEEEESYEEDGKLAYSVTNGDDLDSRYYKVNEEWMTFLNKTFKSHLCIDDRATIK